MKNITSTLLPALILASAILPSCGVKGPPLPPLPSTPQSSDPVVRQNPSPQPSATPSPKPPAKRKKK